MSPVLHAAFENLDGWLQRVCDLEAVRAARLAEGGGAGWEGVKALARAPLSEIRDAALAPELVTVTPPGFVGLRSTFGATEIECDALLVLSDSYISPTCCLTRRCYQASSRSSHPAFTPLSRRLS